jgi:phage tail-like protein
MQPFYPPGAFYFRVAVLGTGAESSASGPDASFQEVSGMQATLEVETVNEGGENRFALNLPRYTKYSNLVLKRGMVARGSALGEWVVRTLGSGLALPIESRDVQVSLLDEKGITAVSWTFKSAYPVRWEASPLRSMESEILIETLELAYNYFDRA